MYCIYCGTPLDADAAFCSKCGKRLNQDTPRTISASNLNAPQAAPPPPPPMRVVDPVPSRPLFVVKPQLMIMVVILPKLYHSGGALFILLIVSLIKLFVSHHEITWIFAFVQWILIFAAIVPPLFTYIAVRGTYDHTEYRAFPDRLEYEEGYFDRSRKTVYFKDIVNVNMYQGVIQGWYGLGTIYLVPRGTVTKIFGIRVTSLDTYSTDDDIRNDQQQPYYGIRLQNVPNPDFVCKRLQQLVQQAQQQ